jgi:hypothetical protein
MSSRDIDSVFQMWELSFDQIRHRSVGSRLPLLKRSVGSGELDEGDLKGQEPGLADAGEDVEANMRFIGMYQGTQFEALSASGPFRWQAK